MNTGPQAGRTRTDHVATAEASWPGGAPDWIVTLAERCNATSQADVAKRISYSTSTVSQVIGNTYRGDLIRVEAMVRGAFMASVVECPKLGEIGRDRCLDWQKKPYAATSSHRVEMYHACQSCPQARGRREEALS